MPTNDHHGYRLVVVIPHYFGPPTLPVMHRSASPSHQLESQRKRRAAVLSRTIMGIHQAVGCDQYMMQLDKRRTDPANLAYRGRVRVVVCTVGDHHLIQNLRLPACWYEHRVLDEPPTELGFACRQILSASIDQADWLGYLEDDLWISDALWIQKLAWFHSFAGDDALLLPNRFERSEGPLATKAYVDGDLAAGVTSRYQNLEDSPTLTAPFLGREVTFVRAKNPHAGCFFLTPKQLRYWRTQPSFDDREPAFVGPLESAATLGIMRSFRIYKSAMDNAGFLEIEHQSTQFIDQLRRPAATPISTKIPPTC